MCAHDQQPNHSRTSQMWSLAGHGKARPEETSGAGLCLGAIQLGQVVRERPEPAGLSHYPWASAALPSYLLPGLFTGCVTIICTFPPAGPEHLGAGPILSYSSASQTAGIKRLIECQLNEWVNDKLNKT